ncbi:MAG: hypothetical protein CBC13_11250 [Planctomycetia bacterium TMED53]|nr:MAG: hypothetical protein CBC13_11250 [Planctomycetia bacterium TMED53]
MKTRVHVVSPGESAKKYDISDELARRDGIRIGRDESAEICLRDPAASRFHALLNLTSSGWKVTDLDSSNGTFVSGDPIKEQLLFPGQHIRIGDTELIVETRIETFSDHPERTQILDSKTEDPGSFSDQQVRQILKTLDQAAPLLGEGFSDSESLDRGLQKLVEGVEADRGAILIQEGDHWLCRTAWSRIGVPLQGFVLSQTILAELLRNRRTVLSRDTSLDPRFEDRRSVTGDEIRSVIAAPIFIEGSLSGILYLDRIDGDSRPLGEAEMWAGGIAAATMGAGLSLNAELDELHHEKEELVKSVLNTHPIIGSSQAIEEVRTFIKKVAPTQGTVLVMGETGTGKELVARGIHFHGSRSAAPFVTINCAAIPPHLVESELFGHEKGAFTGADRKKIGKFEAADGGTVFLDEIGELPEPAQSKMLRLLETRCLEMVGSNTSIEVDVRLIAATNRDLKKEVEAGRFREDLYFRLAVLEIQAPPLRDRSGDIALLAEHFLDQFSDKNRPRKQLTPEAIELLDSHPFPGNVRELRNLLESAVIFSEGGLIEGNDLRLLPQDPAIQSEGEWKPVSLKVLEEEHILKVLEHAGGNKKKAAEILGIERSTLYSRLKNMVE